MLNRLNKDFALEHNTLIREVKENIADKIQLEVGDSKEDLFIPQAKVMRWDNEVNLSVRRDNGARSFVERDGKIVCEGSKEDVVIYELTDIGEDGGLEIELHLKSKPKSNRFDFSIRTKGLDFFYQPALTPEEIEQGASRPDNVVGSYAVYHKTGRNNRVGGMEYKTGKFCHIYRPHVTDADGNEVWGELEIDEEAEMLTVVVPQKFLATASYPVIVDPTFGYTSVGGSTAFLIQTSSPHTTLAGSFFALTEAADVTDISFYGRVFTGGPGNNSVVGRGGIYDASLNFEGGTSESTVSESDAWNDFSYSSPLTLASATFGIVVFEKANPVRPGTDASRLEPKYDSGDTGQGIHRYTSLSYPTWPDPLSNQCGDFGVCNHKFSIYATYTASGGGFNPAIARRRMLR
jgi:hypothetical protein